MMPELTLSFGAYRIPGDVDVLYRGEDVVALEPLGVRVLRYPAGRGGRGLQKEDLRHGLGPGVSAPEAWLKGATPKVAGPLGEGPAAPRSVVTHPRRGYGFIAALAGEGHRHQPPAPAEPARDP